MVKACVKIVALSCLAIAVISCPTFAQDEQKEKDYGIKVISIDPAITGETGIITTLLANTLPQGSFSLALSYHNWDRELTDFDINQFSIALAYGLMDNLEIAASLVVVEQNGYAAAPLIEIFPPPVLTSYPFARTTIEEGLGDLYLGAKYAFIQGSENGIDVAARGFVKIPTSDEEEGFGSGATDWGIGLILSKYLTDSFVLTGNVGMTFLGTPDRFSSLDFGNDIRWGLGSKLFVNPNFRILGELTGANAMDDDDFPQEDIVDLRLGAEFKMDSGLRLGFGLTRALIFDDPAESPNGAFAQLSFSPWRGKAELEEAKRRDKEEQERLAEEERIRKEQQEEQRRKAEEEARRKAEEEARRKAEEEARRKAEEEARRRELEGFEPVDIYFDFDSYVLKEDAVEDLNSLISNLKARPMVTVTIEGHCCYIGTEEYNLALGESRAQAIKRYFIDNGIANTRIETISYGESKPKFDNSEENTRRFNRRGHFTLRLR